MPADLVRCIWCSAVATNGGQLLHRPDCPGSADAPATERDAELERVLTELFNHAWAEGAQPKRNRLTPEHLRERAVAQRHFAAAHARVAEIRQKDAQEALLIISREYNAALEAGCDSDAAFDCACEALSDRAAPARSDHAT